MLLDRIASQPLLPFDKSLEGRLNVFVQSVVFEDNVHCCGFGDFGELSERGY